MDDDEGLAELIRAKPSLSRKESSSTRSSPFRPSVVFSLIPETRFTLSPVSSQTLVTYPEPIINNTSPLHDALQEQCHLGGCLVCHLLGRGHAASSE
jgi:hypothetical protein